MNLDHISRLAIVGVAKNSGKTTTLNALIDALAAPGAPHRTLGLVSAGLDGEERDALLGTPKPRILATPGTLIASASGALERSSATFTLLEPLGFDTPLGPVVLARVRTPGHVLLAGMRHRRDMVHAAQRMEEAGANLVVVDGAYGRTVGAHPDLTRHVLLSTGAACASPGGGVEAVVRATRALITKLAPPVAELPWHRTLISRALSSEHALLGAPDGRSTPLVQASALLGLRDWRPGSHDDHTAIAIPGLVSDSVAEALVARRGTLDTVLISDGTALHASARAQRRLTGALDVRAAKSAEIIGVSVNPTRVVGAPLERDALLGALRAGIPGIYVFDPREDLLFTQG